MDEFTIKTKPNNKISRQDAIYETSLLLEVLKENLEGGADRAAVGQDMDQIINYMRSELIN